MIAFIFSKKGNIHFINLFYNKLIALLFPLRLNSFPIHYPIRINYIKEFYYPLFSTVEEYPKEILINFGLLKRNLFKTVPSNVEFRELTLLNY